MNVKELIQLLSRFPDETRVITNGYEDDYEDIRVPREIAVIHKPDAPWYMGEWEEKDGKEDGAIRAILISRNSRPME